MPELETRNVELRAADTERREIRGIAVPWDELAAIGGQYGYRERFARGALEPHAAGVKLYDQHRQIVGTAETTDTAAGLELLGTVARTAAGNDFLELVRSGAIGHLSIGFEPREQTITEQPDDGGTPIVTRTRAVLGEVSGVPFPAYAGATISEIRSSATAAGNRKDGTMPPTNTEEGTGTEQGADQTRAASVEDVAELRALITDQGRRLDTIGRGPAGGPAPSRFRTAGELLKALAAGDEDARREIRAADANPPATSTQAGADTGAASGWINRPLRLALERRRIMSLFQSAPLPPLGNTVEYPQVASTSGNVGKQANEGDALSYMEVELDTGSATVGTYGGYSQLSRQAIERGNPAYLDAVFRFQAIQYAKATNADARAAFLGMAAGNAVTLTGGHAAASAADWISVIVDGAAAIEDDSLGLLADYIVVSRDVFKSIATLTDLQDRPIFALPNGGQAVNVAGSASPVTAVFNIAGLPGFVEPAAAANTCKIASAGAMTSLESPGAPFRLEDEAVVNLTKDFSLYGYAAFTEDDANGIVDVDVDGV